LITDPEAKKKMVKIVGDATEAAFADPGFKEELSRWIKPSLPKYKDGIPGYTIGVPWIFSFMIPFAISRFAALQKSIYATAVFGVICSETDDAADWVGAGQLYERIALMAEAAGLKTAVLAAPIQIDNFYQKLQDVLETIFRPQVFFRLGYCQKIPVFSPRRDTHEVMIKDS